MDPMRGIYIVLAVYMVGCAHSQSTTPPVVQIINDGAVSLNGGVIQSGSIEQVLLHKYEDAETVLVCASKDADPVTSGEVLRSIVSSGRYQIIFGVDNVCGAEWAKRQMERERSMIELRLETETEIDND
ncbi:MAG: hypothetical protein ACE5FO_05515 [Parvularculaceae bacterium]